MDADFISLFAISLAAFICPILSSLIPRKLIPETVFLLIAGMIIGPNVLGIASEDAAVTLFSDMGLGFLFLLAGYEINPAELTGKQGRHGFITWLSTFAIALGICFAVPESHDNLFGWLAAAIALTTTAFGTLVPILHERGLVGTPVGNAIYSYGTWGELAPVIAIAIMLSTRQTWITLAVLGAFALIAIIVAIIPRRIRDKKTVATEYIEENRDTNAQIIVRAVMVLLVGLLALSALFELDLVLGAFAAGFILRFIIPEGDKHLEHKLDAIGYGFFIPLFFVVSGMSIDPAAIASYPMLLVLFIAALLVVRALPIFVALRLFPESRSMSVGNRATVALYCTTALPLIVAVTSIATSAGAMSDAMASLLIAAGGITVFIMPAASALTFKAMDVEEEHRSE